MADDYSDTTSTTGTVVVGGAATGTIEVPGDRDWFRVTLTAGVLYGLELRSGDALGTLLYPSLALHEADGNLIRDNSGVSQWLARIVYSPLVSGDHFLNAGDQILRGGTYTVAVTVEPNLFSEAADNINLLFLNAPPGQTWRALAGNDFVGGTRGADTIHGDGGNDTIFSYGGDDHLFGGAGDDSLAIWSGTGQVDGGPGTDMVAFPITEASVAPLSLVIDDAGNGWVSGYGQIVLADIENVTGTDLEGTDVILTGAGDNLIIGGSGSDYIDAGGGSDTLYGDFVDGIPAFGCNDTIVGGAGNDTVYGEAPNGAGLQRPDANSDVILLDDYRNPMGPGGDDAGYGSAGNDLIWGYGGNDILDGGMGNDTLVGNDLAVAVDGMNWMKGEAGDDTLFVGLAGKAAMDGGTGNDTLHGGPGDDTLDGGVGSDVLSGGAGADVFSFYDFIAPRFTVEMDMILDFDPAAGDRLHMFRSSDPMAQLTMSDQVFTLPGQGVVDAVYMYNADGRWSAMVYGVDVATLRAAIVHLDVM